MALALSITTGVRQHAEDAVAAGADFHVAKPVTGSSLLEAVARALSLAETAA
jgi:hypothetical protein